MGVIKGSGYSAKTLRSLTRAEYLFKGSKASPAFASEAEREKVYAGFERYEKQKKSRKEIDELDRVGDLLRVLKNDTVLAQAIRRCFEEIYVDGKQSITFHQILDATKHTCRNPRSAVSRHRSAFELHL